MSIPTAVTDREATVLTGLAEGANVLEVGALLGYSTVTLAQVARVVHSVDPHEGYPQHDPRPTLGPFLANLVEAGVRDKVVVHVGTDEEVLPYLRPASFDVAFVDVTGLYEDTLRVMQGCLPLLKRFGALAVHDCGHPEWPGAMRAVRDFSAYLGWRFGLVDRLAVFQ